MQGDWTLHNCDVFAGLARVKPKSVHCIVSSPPYLGLRDYGIPPRTWADGTVCVFGLEPSVDLYVSHTVELFAALGEVLRDDGVIWWNIGSSYASSDVTIDEYVMRDDLSPDEIAFVLEELAKWDRAKSVQSADSTSTGKAVCVPSAGPNSTESRAAI